MKWQATFGPMMLEVMLACTPAQQAQTSQIENLILQDIAQGKDLQQIETDVGIALGGQPGADIVAIVDDGLALLIDLGLVPAGLIPKATSLKASADAQRVARAPK